MASLVKVGLYNVVAHRTPASAPSIVLVGVVTIIGVRWVSGGGERWSALVTCCLSSHVMTRLIAIYGWIVGGDHEGFATWHGVVDVISKNIRSHDDVGDLELTTVRKLGGCGWVSRLDLGGLCEIHGECSSRLPQTKGGEGRTLRRPG